MYKETHYNYSLKLRKRSPLPPYKENACDLLFRVNLGVNGSSKSHNETLFVCICVFLNDSGATKVLLFILSRWYLKFNLKEMATPENETKHVNNLQYSDHFVA